LRRLLGNGVQAIPVGNVGVARDDLQHRLVRVGWQCIE
jgi:hypothetical protein